MYSPLSNPNHLRMGKISSRAMAWKARGRKWGERERGGEGKRGERGKGVSITLSYNSLVMTITKEEGSMYNKPL